MTGLRWSIINILKQNNSQLQAKIEVSEKRVIDQESYINIIDQYSRTECISKRNSSNP